MKTKFVLLLSLAAINSAFGAILFTTESAGVQQTTVPNTFTESFNVLPAAALGSYNSTIGQYGPGATISGPNAWGGANQTRYIAVGAQSNTNFYTLDFANDIAYFGLNWQAADARNELRFFNNGILIQAFNTSGAFSALSSAYNGNPNNGQNTGEKYAFFNFYATGGTVFDRVMFFNDGPSTGFETDNHTILKPRDPVVPTLAVPNPEPATLALVGFTIIAFAFKRRRSHTASVK